jgi:hypothetical protein
MVRRCLRAVLCLALLHTSSLVRHADAQNPAPAAEATATITGTVIDRDTGNPIPDAGVEVVGGGPPVRTDVDGKYVIHVKPGTYDVRFFGPQYQTMRVERITVAPSKALQADVSLAALGNAPQEVVEVVALKKATEQAQLAKRKKAATVGETISAEAMKKSAGSDAAHVVAQSPSVLVKDNKYINIRGLQERYTSAMLNGNRLPSTDPQRRVVPLDLFPAGFLDSLSIVKSYTPDLPGDFSGGLAALDLRDFPDTLTYSFGASTGANTQSTFRPFNTYRGSHYDYLGFGTRFRELAAGTPGSQTDFRQLSTLQRDAIGRQFRDIWDINTWDAPPNFGGTFAVGDRFGPLGFQLAAIYGNEYKHRRNEIANNFITLAPSINQPAELALSDTVLYDNSIFQTKLGGLLTAGYDLAPGQRITFRGLYNRNSTDQVYLGQGFRTNDLSVMARQQTFRYVMEELQWGQLAGEHHWSWVNVDWRSAYARSTQKEPDTRFFTQTAGKDEPFQYAPLSNSGTRLFNDLREYLTDSAVDFTIPFTTALPYTRLWSGLPAAFKFGQAYSYRSRVFVQRRFELMPSCGGNNSTCIDPTLPPGELFAPSNIGLGGWEFVENSRDRDNYTVSQEIAGAYGMFDLPIIRDRLRVVGGLRYEYSYIQLNGFAQTQGPNGEALPTKTIINNHDPLPGVNVIYNPRDDMNARFAWSQSVSRPDFRELSPSQYLAPLGELQTQGNPTLVEAHITSWDARWEWFFGPLELVSLGFFHKKLEQPIEETVLPQSSNSIKTWANAVDGHITGFEFEGRKNFGFLAPMATALAPYLRYLSFLANVTYTQSEVFAPRLRIQGFGNTIQTNTRRALQGQAPYIANAAIDYTHPTWGSIRLNYNTIGPYIALVGTSGLPDIVQDRHSQLDLLLSSPLQHLIGLPLTLNLTVENILNDRINWTLGQGLSPSAASQAGPAFDRPGVKNGVYKRFTTGVGFNLAIGYSF